MHLLRSASRQPRMETPAVLQVCTTPKCKCIRIKKTAQDTITAPHHVLSRCVFISKKFPRLLAEREIIANAFCLSGFLPEPLAKIVIIFETNKKMRKFLKKKAPLKGQVSQMELAFKLLSEHEKIFLK